MTEEVTFEKPDGKGKGGQLVLKGSLAMNLPGTPVEESKYMNCSIWVNAHLHKKQICKS